ncbi:MAG: 16S rRNA (cytidine(1402)-2'-O)-methyltransferase [Enterobacteriaceae bacterium]
MNKKKIANLYVVPTPIGNLKDTSFRAIDVLNFVDFICAENIFKTYVFLKKYNIKNRIISLNKENEYYKYKLIIKKIKSGYNIALVCNSGTPNISDPGKYLIHKCHEKNIKIIPLPGPCAAITAISASGLDTKKFFYEGFIPREKPKVIDFFKKIKNRKETTIVYESKYRIIKSIKILISVLGEKKKLTLVKELTKINEKIYKDKAINILNWLKNDKLNKKGEITLIIEKSKNKEKKIKKESLKKIFLMFNKKLSFKDSIFFLSKIYNLKKNYLYDKLINLK